MRCSARAHELRPARGRPVKVDRFACPQPQHPLINAHARALHQPLVPPVFRCNQHPSRAAHLQPHAQPQDDATPSVDDLLSQLDDLAIPDIDQDLRTFQEQAGALFLVRYVSHTGRLTQIIITGRVVPTRELWQRRRRGRCPHDWRRGRRPVRAFPHAHQHTRACSSDCVRVRVAGPECRQFLHNMTTNTFLELPAGRGCSTVRQVACHESFHSRLIALVVHHHHRWWSPPKRAAWTLPPATPSQTAS